MSKRTQIRFVEWRDLVGLTPLERGWELVLGIPWLVLSLWFYGHGWWWAGLGASFYVFLTGLRQSHNAQHYSLGLSRWLQDGVLFALSVLMFASMHAVQVTHLHHHRHCLDADDGEGATAKMSWWKAVLYGPVFILRLHLSAWSLAESRKRVWIVAELAAIALVLSWALWFTDSLALEWHTSAMLAGECLTGFFAVWTVHHGCAAHEPGRTQRVQWLNRLSYSMFFHAEHHLFPAVPTSHLPDLARRIDAATPEVRERLVLNFGRSFSNRQTGEVSPI